MLTRPAARLAGRASVKTRPAAAEPKWSLKVTDVGGNGLEFDDVLPTDKLSAVLERVVRQLEIPTGSVRLCLGNRVFSEEEEGQSLGSLGIGEGAVLSRVRRVSYEEALQGCESRHKAFEGLGVPDVFIMAPLIGPALMGGPQWPTRPAWRWIRGQRGLICSSDALSDPWDASEEGAGQSLAGFGLEVFLGSHHLFSNAIQSAVITMSNTIAEAGGTRVRDLIEETGCISSEVLGAAFPSALLSARGTVGILLGRFGTHGIPEEISLPGGSVLLMEMVVLHPRELTFIRLAGEAARTEIYRRLREASDRVGGQRWVSSASRLPVVPAEVDEGVEQTAEMVARWSPAPPDPYWTRPVEGVEA